MECCDNGIGDTPVVIPFSTTVLQKWSIRICWQAVTVRAMRQRAQQQPGEDEAQTGNRGGLMALRPEPGRRVA
jgi:hypothetical protein